MPEDQERIDLENVTNTILADILNAIRELETI